MIAVLGKRKHKSGTLQISHINFANIFAHINFTQLMQKSQFHLSKFEIY